MRLTFHYSKTILPISPHVQVVQVILVYPVTVGPGQVKLVHNYCAQLFESVLYPYSEPHLRVMCSPDPDVPHNLHLTLFLVRNEADQIRVRAGRGNGPNANACLSEIHHMFYPDGADTIGYSEAVPPDTLS